MSWRRIPANHRADALLQVVVERHAVAQHDEQHDANIVFPVLSDRDALDNLVELLDLAIYLRRADTDTAGVQDGIRAPVDY